MAALLPPLPLLVVIAALAWAPADIRCDYSIAGHRQSRQFGSNLVPENETLTCHQCRASYLPGVSLFKCEAIGGRSFCTVPKSTGKCASQTQVQFSLKVGAEVHTVLRICYNTAEVNHAGNKSWLNHTDGCRFATNPVNYTALYCFCSEDLCNATPARAGAASGVWIACAAAILIILAGQVEPF